MMKYKGIFLEMQKPQQEKREDLTRKKHEGHIHNRESRTDPTVIFIKGITTSEATANADWVNRYFAASRLFPPSSIANVDIFHANGKMIVKVWMKSADHARHVMLNKTRLRNMMNYREVYLERQRTAQEREEFYKKRQKRMYEREKQWTGANAIPMAGSEQEIEEVEEENEGHLNF